MGFNLDEVFEQYGHPDPAIVQTREMNGVTLDYVGHAEITKALSEVDPSWTWQPALGQDGLPAIRIQHGKILRRDKDPLLMDMATMWGTLTLNGVTRWAVGSVEAHKPDLDKELVSDFLRNAAMRFGIALGLWMKKSSQGATNKVQRSGNDGGAVPMNRGGFGPQPNKYAGKCIRCGGQVAAEQGLRDKDGDKWVTFHKDGQCTDDEAPF